MNLLERYSNHPRFMDEKDLRQLPPSRWHQKVTDRYPIGSPTELYRRMDDAFYRGLAQVHGNFEFIDLFRMQPLPGLLDTIDNPVDIVACALVSQKDQSIVLLLEDRSTQDNPQYTFGKSTIMRSLVNLRPLHTSIGETLGISPNSKVSASELLNRLANVDKLEDKLDGQIGMRVLASDITYIGRSPEEQLVALAIAGTREDVTWDIARSAVRYFVDNFDRSDAILTQAQIELAEKLRLDEGIWVNIDVPYPIGEIIFLKQDPALTEPITWGNTFTRPEDIIRNLELQLVRNPIYLSTQTAYWSIDYEQHRKLIQALLSREFLLSPTIRYLHLRDPREPDILAAAAITIKQMG